MALSDARDCRSGGSQVMTSLTPLDSDRVVGVEFESEMLCQCQKMHLHVRVITNPRHGMVYLYTLERLSDSVTKARCE